MRQNKKGIALEISTLLVILFAIAIVVFMGKILVDDLNTDIQNDADMQNQTKEISLNVQSRYSNIFDGAIIFFFILFWIAILVSAYLIDTSPVFVVVSVILLAMTLLVAMSLDNAYSEIITDTELTAMPVSFPMTNFLLSNLTKVILVVGISLVVVLYGKTRQ